MWTSIPLIGTRVRSSHPVTVLNPSEVFEVAELKISNGYLPDGTRGPTVYVRGGNTCWFHISMISPE